MWAPSIQFGLRPESGVTDRFSGIVLNMGIDVVAVPVAELLQACGLPGVEDVPPGEHLIVLDCEGGNNAMANIRSLVNVFGIVVGTEVVFVANSMASEQALQNLGATLAARSMIRLDGAAALTEQHLVFAVNKNTLKYQGSALEKILNQDVPCVSYRGPGGMKRMGWV
ncbi:unnamed protein product [Prorocentrum cordatum]|uniref:Uncharacterized protein n=1 Tax=Prorocentrum cordatum TaxID=2364126 RepID=A0ABN9XHF5_9DINO|nr:unnamed protein product [Polarella glacialis]